MTFTEFHNALRVLLNIDGDEFLRALWPNEEPNFLMHDEAWEAFDDDPHMWFIKAPDAAARAIWAIVEERMK